MTYLLTILRNNLVFLIPYGIGCIVALFFIIFHGKIDAHLIINNMHNDLSDTFFRYYTDLGGWIPYLIALILLLFRHRMALIILISQAITTIVTATLKHIFLAPRPFTVFSNIDIDIHMVDGVTPHTIYSFPSGHTAAAFALFFAFTLFCRKGWQKFTCFSLASLVGFSRIYLSQHFLEDTLAGSAIGILSVIIIIPIIKRYDLLNTHYKGLLYPLSPRV